MINIIWRIRWLNCLKKISKQFFSSVFGIIISGVEAGIGVEIGVSVLFSIICCFSFGLILILFVESLSRYTGGFEYTYEALSIQSQIFTQPVKDCPAAFASAQVNGQYAWNGASFSIYLKSSCSQTISSISSFQITSHSFWYLRYSFTSLKCS